MSSTTVPNAPLRSRRSTHQAASPGGGRTTQKAGPSSDSSRQQGIQRTETRRHRLDLDPWTAIYILDLPLELLKCGRTARDTFPS